MIFIWIKNFKFLNNSLDSLVEKRSQSLKLIKINTKKENLIVSDPYNFRHISHVGTETNGPIKFYDLMELKRNKYK